MGAVHNCRCPGSEGGDVHRLVKQMSRERRIPYDLDPDTGRLGNRRRFFGADPNPNHTAIGETEIADAVGEGLDQIDVAGRTQKEVLVHF